MKAGPENLLGRIAQWSGAVRERWRVAGSQEPSLTHASALFQGIDVVLLGVKARFAVCA